MDQETKRQQVEQRIGQTLEEYFSQGSSEHAPIRTIARELGISLITAKIWAERYRPGKRQLTFGVLLTALFVLIIAGVLVGAWLTLYWLNRL
ncbi:MAG: hypothetical protein HY710_09685 [Candidatus Latescibacteria bacterium]|nr:hypothetical protein [Candidatus Latescibacterota bacterium]